MDFWKEKISGNKNRDLKNHLELNIQGWRQLTVWECAIKGKHRLSIDQIIKNIEVSLMETKVKLKLGASYQLC